MKYCNNCGNELIDSSFTYCTFCGKLLNRFEEYNDLQKKHSNYCVNCGDKNEFDNFCTKCGNTLFVYSIVQNSNVIEKMMSKDILKENVPVSYITKNLNKSKVKKYSNAIFTKSKNLLKSIGKSISKSTKSVFSYCKKILKRKKL